MPRTTRASIASGVGSNDSPAATAARPRYPSSILAISGVGGTWTRSGFCDGWYTPTVRLFRVRYAAATRLTSAAVTFSSRSRWRNSSRQSPTPAQLPSASASWSLAAASRSAPRRNRSRTRSTSSSVIGFAASPSTAAISASRAASIPAGSATSAARMIAPGSCRPPATPSTPVAFFDSTSALYSRPAGLPARHSASTSTAAKSGCAPAGMWYSTPTPPVDPTRRSVTTRSPSCGGSSVYVFGSGSSGFFSGPKCSATRSRAFFSSNFPATTSSALSGR